jgi:hypothetical protein
VLDLVQQKMFVELERMYEWEYEWISDRSVPAHLDVILGSAAAINLQSQRMLPLDVSNQRGGKGWTGVPCLPRSASKNGTRSRAAITPRARDENRSGRVTNMSCCTSIDNVGGRMMSCRQC